MEYVQRELPYVRSFVLRSVYGVLRQEGITFGEEEPGRVIAEWREDGTDVSLSITAEEKAFGTELTVSLRRPCDGIPEQRAYRLLQEILLCPSNPQAAVSALEEAVALGEISEERINQSVRRILAMKVNRGVLKLEG